MRRRKLILGLLVLSGVALFLVWRVGYQGGDPRLIFWPPREGLGIPAALEEQSEIDVDNVPLREALALLGERHGVQIELDSLALQDLALTGDEPVSCRFSGVKLKSVLAVLLDDFQLQREARQRAVIAGFPGNGGAIVETNNPHDLTVRSRDGVIHITTASAWDGRPQNYVTRVYRLDRLLALPFPVSESDLLSSLISARFASGSWTLSGGQGILRDVPGAIVVSHTPEVHAEIVALLDRLAELGESDEPPAMVRLHPLDPGEAAMARALAEPTEIDATETPLEEVCQALSRRHGIPIRLDMRSLNSVGIESEHPITCRLSSISLRSALAIMLKECELTILARDDVLYITTPEVRDNNLSTALFPVGDLVSVAGGLEYDSLIDLITTMVAPTTWSDGNRTDDISGIGGTLVVSQTDDVLAQIEALLTDLRGTMLPAAIADSSGSHLAPRDETPTLAVREGYVKLQQALNKPVSFDFDNVPLREAAARLAELGGINVLLDRWALKGEEKSDETPVRFRADNMPLWDAARFMLDPLDLAPQVRNECLVFTTPEVAGYAFETRCYRLASLLPASYSVGSDPTEEAYFLVEFVRSIITSHGGFGAEGYSFERFGNVLVVTTNRQAHQTLVGLLAAIERMQRTSPSTEPVLVGDASPERSLWLYDTGDLAARYDNPLATVRFLFGSPLEERFDLGAGIMGLAGNSHRHHAAERLLAAIREATASDATWPIDAGLVDNWPVRVYPLGDLRRAINSAVRVLPSTEALPRQTLSDKLTRMRAALAERMPLYMPTDVIYEPLDMLDVAFRDCLKLDADAFLGDLLAWKSTSGEHTALEVTLARLRKIFVAGKTVEEALAAEDTVGRPPIDLYDLRPLFVRVPELDERQVAEIVAACTWWERDEAYELPGTLQMAFFRGGDVDFRTSQLVARKNAPLAALPGLLWFRSPLDVHEIESACRLLTNLPAGYPRPYEIFRDDNIEAIAKLTALLEREQDPTRRGYLFWLCEQTGNPSRELIETLARLAAEEVISRLAARFLASDDEYERLLLLKTLPKLGIAGELALLRFATTPQLEAYQDKIVSLLWPVRAQDEFLAGALLLFRDSSLNRERLLAVLEELDAGLSESERILTRWKQEPAGSENRRRAVEIEEIIRALDSEAKRGR